MAETVVINPITRIEGHLAVRVETESNRVVSAFSSGEMFRGFEVLLKGRDPLDAQVITQRICGVCPIAHGMASVLAQDLAYGIAPPTNGRLMRNLILAANLIQSHILHFYHLSALDYVDIGAISKYRGSDGPLRDLQAWVRSQTSSSMVYPAAPFLPRYDGKYLEDMGLNISAIKHYLDAFEMRALAHQAAALFGGKMPHASTLLPGGFAENVTAGQIAAFRSKLNRLQTFIRDCYLPDVEALTAAFPEYLSLGRGCGSFLAYGAYQESSDQRMTFLPSGVLVAQKPMPFDESRITEDVRHSFFSSRSGLSPSEGETIPAQHKTGAYSWVKAPRYDENVVEVGPLARILIAYGKGHPPAVKAAVDQSLARVGRRREDLVSVLGRHLCRALESKIVADRCAEWLDQLTPGEPTYQDFEIPKEARGVGLTEAPRGALGHWLEIRDYKIERYQCVVPTSWNCSPRDDDGNLGPVEQALVGTPIEDPKNPIEATRVVRSFDPCLACAVH